MNKVRALKMLKNSDNWSLFCNFLLYLIIVHKTSGILHEYWKSVF